MPTYMALLYESPEGPGEMSPAEIQAVIEKYKAWRDKLGASGHLVDGRKLKDREGRVMRSERGQVRVLDGPYSETKEVVAGYFSIEAADYDQAVSLAETCPHLDYGTIEIRRIDEIH